MKVLPKEKDEILLSLSNVNKKFCKILKKSLLYGFYDVFFPQAKRKIKLRTGEFWAIKDLNLTLKRGEILGILGVNGSGKTTLIRLITSTYPVTSGKIKVRGRIVTVYVKKRAFNRLYSGKENIRVKCALFGLTKQEINDKMDKIIDFAEINDFADAPFGTYSSGMKSRVNIAISLFSEPDILIIDEGFAVSDMHFRKKSYEKLKEISKNCAIIVISHDIEHIRNIAKKIIIMDKGHIVFETNNLEEGISKYSNWKKK